MNEIYETDSFTELLNSLPNNEKQRIEKIKIQLQNNSKIGKPLGFEWFREKYIEGKRLYYLLYLEVEPNKILLIAYGNKKQQQNIINFIKDNKEDFKQFLTKDYKTL